jgi:hypothetical protein
VLLPRKFSLQHGDFLLSLRECAALKPRTCAMSSSNAVLSIAVPLVPLSLLSGPQKSHSKGKPVDNFRVRSREW